MSNLATYPLEDWFITTLAQSWNWAVGTVYVNDTPSFTFPSGVTTYIVVDPGKSTMQAAIIDSYDANANTLNVSSITLNKWAGVAYTQQTHSVGAIVIISDNYQFWEDIATAINSKLGNDGTNSTSAFDLALTGSSWRSRNDGGIMKFRDDANPEVSLSTLASGWGADTKVAVTINDTTPAVLDSKLTAGDGLSKTVINPAWNEQLDLDIDLADTTIFVQTSSGSGDSGKVPRLGASGTLASGFIPSTVATNKFWGTWADGAIDGTSNVTITGSNSTYIVKNYTSWAAWTAARILTITPTNCLLHIKIQGNCDLTNWSFSFNGKGWQWGAQVTGTGQKSGNDWEAGADLITWFVNSLGGKGNPSAGTNGTGWGGGAGKTASGSDWVTAGIAGGTGGTKASWGSVTTVIAGRRYTSYIGSGWGSGGIGSGASGSPVWGAGWNGGWAVILEVLGNLTLDNGTTVINMNGTNWANWVAGTNAGAGWGWGWGGGTFLCLYGGTLTGTVTPTVAWWSAGTGANGGSTLGSAGGAGGAWEYVITKNTVFA